MSDQDPFHEDGVLSHLAQSTHRVLDELTAIRGMLEERPRRSEVARRRRGTALFIGLIILVAVQGVDAHTELCGPGKRSDAVVRAFARHEIKTERDLNRVADRAAPHWLCGFTFPTHTHDGNSYPQPQHIAGIIFYLALIGGGYAWYRWPDTWDRKAERNDRGRRSTDRKISDE